jgi:hypothetical protein
LDVIRRRPVEGAVAAMLDARSGRAHEQVRRCDALDGTERIGLGGKDVAIHLGCVEYARRAGDAAFAVVFGVAGIGLGLELLEEDDGAGFLAGADLCAEFESLAVRGP